MSNLRFLKIMKITIVAVGLRQPAWADTAVEDYLGRFPKDWNVTVKAVKPELRAGQSTANIMKIEAERIRAAVPHNSLIIAMDEHGKDLTTQDFAKKIRSWRDNGESLCFIIGGTDGLDPQLKSQAHMLMRLSSMTLPHAMARVMLAEQIYRAFSLLTNHPYHRA